MVRLFLYVAKKTKFQGPLLVQCKSGPGNNMINRPNHLLCHFSITTRIHFASFCATKYFWKKISEGKCSLDKHNIPGRTCAQGCKSLLSIRRKVAILAQFCPIFNNGGDEPWPRSFSGWQIKGRPKEKGLHQKWNTFSPKLRWRTKKNGLHQKFTRFEVETCSHMHTRVKLLEGMQIKTIIKILGGIQSNYWGDISPIPPGFRHRCMCSYNWLFSRQNKNLESKSLGRLLFTAKILHETMYLISLYLGQITKFNPKCIRI